MKGTVGKSHRSSDYDDRGSHNYSSNQIFIIRISKRTSLLGNYDCSYSYSYSCSCRSPVVCLFLVMKCATSLLPLLSSDQSRHVTSRHMYAVCTRRTQNWKSKFCIRPGTDRHSLTTHYSPLQYIIIILLYSHSVGVAVDSINSQFY